MAVNRSGASLSGARADPTLRVTRRGSVPPPDATTISRRVAMLSRPALSVSLDLGLVVGDPIWRMSSMAETPPLLAITR